MNSWTASLLPWAEGLSPHRAPLGRKTGWTACMNNQRWWYAPSGCFPSMWRHYEKGRIFFQTSICSQLCKVTDPSLHFSYNSVTLKYRHLILQPHCFRHLYGLETRSSPSFFPYSFLQNSLGLPHFQEGKRYLFHICPGSSAITTKEN